MILEKTMLEYVLERDNSNKYANFLNLKLKMEMFVPCDDDGNVIPDKENHFTRKEIEDWQKAKEKVLFEGFYYVKMSKIHALYNEIGIFESGANLEYIFKGKTIESILTEKLTLTKAGQKLAGLI